MAGENYTVQYNLKVNDNGAIKTLQSFTTATANLTKADGNLDLFAKKIQEITGQLTNMARKSPTLKINTGTVNRQLDNIIRKLERIQALSKKGLVLSATTGTTGRGGGGSTNIGVAGGGGQQRGPAPKNGGTSTPKPKAVAATPKRSSGGRGGTRYQALGQTLIDTGGVGMLDFAKGMGIAYGIAGLGTLVGNVVRDAAEYNNIIQTTKNILGTHDKGADFGSRFKGMESIVRQVGIETKFTAPQVADASKFLAMAGFDLEAINKSIKPIADIALVGDTDLGQTADVVTNIMTGYGIAPERLRHAADVMTMTFTKSNTTLMEIAESYKYAASLLALNGTSFEEATAAIGILGDAGIKGSQAGTTMRTMALNIAKPTKAQREMWERLGISRTDENGNIRPLIDIFTDLNKKDLNLTQFGSLFHKTATQGAASLAAHVDKWNEMVRLNFLSDDITEKLAKEKKNTIQGLWYQLTSSFTEAGMQAFEMQEGKIRGVLSSAIDWLQSKSTIDKIKHVADSIMEMGRILIDFTKIIAKLYEKFEPLILGWFKWQLYLKAALIPMRVMSSIDNFIRYLLNLARGFGAAASSAGVFATKMGVANAAMSKGYSLATVNRWMALNGGKAASGKSPLLYGGLASAGALVGGFLGSQIGESGSPANSIGTLGGAVGGAALFSGLPQLFSWIWKVLPKATKFFLLFNQAALAIGGGAIAAITALGIALYKNYQRTEQATAACRDFFQATQNLNGINYSESASAYDKYMSTIVDRQLSANAALGEYIRLRREELGLNNKEAEEIGGKAFDKDTLKKFTDAHTGFSDLFHWKSAANVNAILDTGDASLNATALIPNAALANKYMGLAVNPNTGTYAYGNYFNFKGVDFFANEGQTHDDAIRKVAGAQMAYALGRDLAEGSQAFELRNQYLQRFRGAKSISDFNDIYQQIVADNASRLNKSNPASKGWMLSDYENVPMATSYWYNAGLNDVLTSMFNPQSGNALGEIAFLSSALQNDNFDAYQYLAKYAPGLNIFDSSNGTPLSDAWMENLLFKNGQWQAGQFKDADGNVTYFRAGESAKIMTQMYNDILTVMNQFSPIIKSKFQEILNQPQWGLAFNPTMPGENDTKEYDGIKWQYRDGLWHPLGSSTAAPMNNFDMQQKSQSKAGFMGGNSNAAGTAGGNGSNGNSNPGYSNQYKSSSVTPKQIIVKIENLMNVESVDMSDPNVAATVNNLKEQMAQALIDVVADFDANASNLT